MGEDTRPLQVALVLAGMLVLEAALTLFPGGLAINGHEVDAIHAAGAALRIAEGARPHFDFVTPLGVLTFLPVALLVKAGLGVGTAFVAAQLAVAAVLAPMIWHVAASRLPGLAAPVFAAVLVAMLTALVYGGENATVSISMYYNRWAWALYFLAVAVMLLPGSGSRLADGLVLGLCLSALALLKATFFVTLAPVVAVWLVMRRDPVLAAVIGAVGLAVAALATLAFGGFGFWLAYAHDLQMVAGSAVRPAPGKGLGEIMASPAYFGGTLCLLGAIMGLRMGGLRSDGLILFLLAPGFVYITYQNWGNDPKWLLLLGFLALGWRFRATGAPFGVPARGYFAGLALACFALSAQTLVNMALSTVRHAGSDLTAHVPIAADPRHGDLLIERKRSFEGEAMVDIPVADGETATLMLAGTDVGGCTQKFGYFGKMVEISDTLKAEGLGDALIALVDVNNPLPLIGGFRQIGVEAPWYYGGTAAAAAADYLLVPKCPVSKVTFKAYVDALNASGLAWAMVAETRHYRLFTQTR